MGENPDPLVSERLELLGLVKGLLMARVEEFYRLARGFYADRISRQELELRLAGLDDRQRAAMEFAWNAAESYWRKRNPRLMGIPRTLGEMRRDLQSSGFFDFEQRSLPGYFDPPLASDQRD